MKNLGQGRSKSDSDAIIDEKKRKRMMSNRESARRSRLKRQKRIEDLAREVGELTRKIEDYKKMLTMTLTKASLLETENDKLSAEKKILAEYLLECNLILTNCKQQTSCFPIKKEISNMEPKLQMWEVQGHSQIEPIIASRMFTF